MAEDIWPIIHAERRALASDLDRLTDQQWQTQSLCADWTVAQVLAHQLATAMMTPPAFLGNMIAAGFNFNAFAAKQVSRRGAGGPTATLEAFRAATDRTSSPPGPKVTWIGEAFVHGEDIRRPLGIPGRYPLDQVATVIAFYAGSNALIGGKRRVAGLTLRATDADIAVGDGPEVSGPAVSLMLATAGRGVALDDLAGPGLDTLRGRFG
jgi:uncharacterized protein (TIGR03083 family)